MIELYHAKHSRSMRILWLLEELNLNFKLNEINFKDLIQFKHHSEAYLKLHPQGQVPLIIDDGFTLYESGAIALYLSRLYDKQNTLSPYVKDIQSYATYTQWVFWACCNLEAPAFTIMKHTVLLPKEKRNLQAFKSASKKYHEVLQVVEATLAKQDYLLGEHFSVVDIMVAATLEWYPRILKKYPNILRYQTTYRQRQAFKKAYSK